MDLVAALALIMLAIHEAARLALAESGEKGGEAFPGFQIAASFAVTRDLLDLYLRKLSCMLS